MAGQQIYQKWTIHFDSYRYTLYTQACWIVTSRSKYTNPFDTPTELEDAARWIWTTSVNLGWELALDWLESRAANQAILRSWAEVQRAEFYDLPSWTTQAVWTRVWLRSHSKTCKYITMILWGCLTWTQNPNSFSTLLSALITWFLVLM